MAQARAAYLPSGQGGGQAAHATVHRHPRRQAAKRVPNDPAGACEAAIQHAEARYGLPKGLLRAIALVETGRRDPRTGALRPWPWSLNAQTYAGGTVQSQSMTFASAGEAIARVELLHSQGILSIDIGCLQINQVQHPDSFLSLAEGFDPERNVDYAARFLRALHEETASWIVAAGYYHSRTPALADPYRREVALHYSGAPLVTPQVIEVSEHEVMMRKLKAAWAATLVASRR